MSVVIRIVLTFGVVVATLLFADEPKTLLNPLDPIAADGSFKAGRALTILDMDPASEGVMPDLDDPRVFEERFSTGAVERDRDAVLMFAGALGPALCERNRHQQLIAAIQGYYGTKRALTAEYHFRGPRAGRFIDTAWMTPKDRQIEALVQQLLDAGYLRRRQIWLRDHSFLRDTWADYLSDDACSRL